MNASKHAALFEGERRRLRAIAHRMTGSLMDAEDAVQDVYLRFQGCDLDVIQAPRAYLAQLVTRVCLDQLKSARVRRERYVGTWLPEPVLDGGALTADSTSELAADISMALMLALERLSPLERAAFLLHDVFDVGYEEVAVTLARSEEACRQLAARARRQVLRARPRMHSMRPEPGDVQRVLRAFAEAAAGDIEPLRQVLAQDAVYYSDGGGRVKAATRPVLGRDRIVRFFEGIIRKFPDARRRSVPVELNSTPGLLLMIEADIEEAMLFELQAGQLAAIYSVRNPAKLRATVCGSQGSHQALQEEAHSP